MQPTRATVPETGRRRKARALTPSVAPIRSCSRRGLPCPERRRSGGALLPHPFTLTACAAVCFLWRYPWGRPRRPLSGAVSPWSPDFPLLNAAAVQPTGFLGDSETILQNQVGPRRLRRRADHARERSPHFRQCSMARFSRSMEAERGSPGPAKIVEPTWKPRRR